MSYQGIFTALALGTLSGQLAASVKITDEVAKPVVSSSLASSIWQMAAGLALVLGVIFLLAWLLRRVSGVQGARQHIKILSAVNVGTRERAVLVEVAGEQLLLGVAAGNVSLLHKLEQPVPSEQVSVVRGDFASKLQSAAAVLSSKGQKADD
ncbi:MAG: flagellar biosynthetic protein FliO [Pseudomonadales bacterium]